MEKKDIIDGFVSINKSMHQYKKEFKSLKTNSICQKIQQNKHVLEMITPLMELDGPMLFEDYEDLSSTSIQLYFSNGIKKWNQHLKDIGGKPIPKIRLHDMRHSHATFLICKGANILAVSQRLGYSDINMTLKFYTYFIERKWNKVSPTTRWTLILRWIEFWSEFEQ